MMISRDRREDGKRKKKEENGVERGGLSSMPPLRM
jgi:hypothetical protein